MTHAYLPRNHDGGSELGQAVKTTATNVFGRPPNRREPRPLPICVTSNLADSVGHHPSSGAPCARCVAP